MRLSELVKINAERTNIAYLDVLVYIAAGASLLNTGWNTGMHVAGNILLCCN